MNHQEKTISVLFVCLGNICRSPTAQALFQAKVNESDLKEKIIVDSAGTGGWHAGAPPDSRAQQVALKYGYDMSHLQARKVAEKDFIEFDYILAMDQQNLTDLQAIQPKPYQGVIGLFLSEAGVENIDDVPDPFYGDQQHFEYAMTLISNAVDGLLKRIQMEHGL